MQTVVIRDIDGNILHEGEADSRKEFVANLIARGRSLARADLADANLSHLRLDGGIFDGANLRGSNLTGTSARRTSFAGADLRGIVAPGLLAERADLRATDLRPHPATGATVALDGAILTYAHLDGSTLDRVDLGDAAMSSVSFIGARIRRTSFARARLHNVDWARSDIAGCDFEDADMSPTMRIAEPHLPDRTSEAAIVGNSLRGTNIGVGNDGFRQDRIVGQAMTVATWGAVSGAVIGLEALAPIDLDADLLHRILGQGAGFIAATTAVTLLKEHVGDAVKERLELAADWLHRRMRGMSGTAARRCSGLASVAVAMVSRDRADLLLSAIRKGTETAPILEIGNLLSGRIRVLACDRGHLADGLALLSEAFVGRMGLNGTTVVVRPGMGSPNVPRSLVIAEDGSISAIWRLDDGTTSTRTWETDTTVHSPRIPARDECLLQFARAMLDEHDAADMGIEFSSHAVRRGRDGSVVVIRRSDGRVDNRHGPALMTPDGTKWHFRNGRNVDDGGRRDDHDADALSPGPRRGAAGDAKRSDVPENHAYRMA